MSEPYIPSLKDFAYTQLSPPERVHIASIFGLGMFKSVKRCGWCNGFGAKYMMDTFNDYESGFHYPSMICQKCFDNEVIISPIPYDVIGQSPAWDNSLSTEENNDIDERWHDKLYDWQKENGIEYLQANACSNPDGATYIWKLFDGSPIKSLEEAQEEEYQNISVSAYLAQNMSPYIIQYIQECRNRKGNKN